MLPTPRSFFSFFLSFLERRDLLVDRRPGDGHGRRRVLLVPLHQLLGLVGRNECALHAHRLALAGREKQHVAVAQQRLRAVLIENGAAVDLRGDAEGDAARKVCLDQTGDHVHRGALCGKNQVNADRAGFLRKHRERRFDLALHGEHQVGELVDEKHDVGQDATRVHRVERQLLLNARLGGQCFARPFERRFTFDLLIEVGDVPGVVGVEQPVAALHFPHGPLQHVRRLVMARHHRQAEVRQRAVHRQLDHLRVDHEQLQLLRPVRVHQARNDGVDADRLS